MQAVSFLGNFAFCFFLVVPACWASSTPAQETSALIDPVIVTASRSARLASQSADHADVMTAEHLRHLPAHNLGEALRYMPGVDLQSGGPWGQPSAVSIRGASSRQVLVMVDGIPFNTQLSGQADLSIIPVENIQQIEVIKGGNSSSWGSGLGGVINVLTKPAGTSLRPHAQVTSTFGAFHHIKNSLNVDGNAGGLGYNAFGSFANAHGNLADSRTRETKTFSKFKLDLNASTSVTAGMGYAHSRRRYGPSAGSIFVQPSTARYGNLRVNVNHDAHEVGLDYKLNLQKIVSTTLNASTWQQTFSTHSRSAYHGLSFKDIYEWSPDQVLTSGMDADWNMIKSSTYLPASKGITTVAPYTNLLWSVNDWDLIPALRWDYNNRFGSQLSPSWGMVYHVPGWTGGVVRGKVARVFNAPPLLWLYNNSPALLVASNPDLKAERAVTYEVGVQGVLLVPRLTAKLDLYYSHVKDAISVTFNGSNFQSRNFSKFVRRGGEFRLDYTLTQRLRMYTGLSFNDVRNAETKKIVRDAGVTRQSFKWGAHLIGPWNVRMSLEGAYNRWSSAPAQANDRKPIFDLKFSKTITGPNDDLGLEIFINLYNLTNSKYWANPSYPLPGRQVEGGLTIRF